MIYLASQSPRRAELLRQIGVQYQVHAADIDERKAVGETPVEYVCRMAKTKARVAQEAIARSESSWVIIAADTTIALDGDVIGKPEDTGDCCRILRMLSARQHQVLTAVAVATPDWLEHRLNRSRVEFRALRETEISAYCACEEPRDKAGAYAVQGRAAIFIERLEGSYSGVMGLPLCETAELLRHAEIEILEQ